MNRRFFIGMFVTVLAATTVSFGAARWFSRREAVSIHDVANLQRALGLAENQTAKIAKFETEFRETLGRCCGTHCDARLDLGNELRQPTLDIAKAQACVARMCAAQTDAEQATLAHILRVRELLTPAQRAKYAQLITEQLCTPATMELR